MFPSNWILKTLSGFPFKATRLTLAGLAEKHGALSGEAVLDGLVAERRVVMVGKARGARYVLPGTKVRKRRK